MEVATRYKKAYTSTTTGAHACTHAHAQGCRDKFNHHDCMAITAGRLPYIHQKKRNFWTNSIIGFLIMQNPQFWHCKLVEWRTNSSYSTRKDNFLPSTGCLNYSLSGIPTQICCKNFTVGAWARCATVTWQSARIAAMVPIMPEFQTCSFFQVLDWPFRRSS